MTSRRARRHRSGARFRGVIAVLALAIGTPALAQAVDAKQVLTKLGFPADTHGRVMAGELVSRDVESSNDRELATGLAFFVKESPKALLEDLRAGLLLQVDENTLAHGEIQAAASLADFAGVKLDAEEAKAYQKAEAGGDLNLSAAEIKAFDALAGKPAAQVEAQVRKSLLARAQTYQKSGLAGIAPYARDGEKRDVAADLRSASEAAKPLKTGAPSFYQTLLGYPKKPEGFTEKFNWMRYKAHGTPVLILTHAFWVEEGDAFAVCQRQFYVSASYNAEQALAAFLPVEGGTVIAYVNRTSTDQVTGFGGSAKRSIGAKVLASQLHDLFAKLSKAAAK